MGVWGGAARGAPVDTVVHLVPRMWMRTAHDMTASVHILFIVQGF